MNYFNGKKILHVVKKEDTPLNLQEKTITPQNFTPEITPDSGYSALSKVKLKGILVDTHQSYTSQTDSTVAYQKTTPTGALKYASLDKVGGMSYKCNQLLDLDNITISTDAGSSVTYTVNADKSITIVNSGENIGRVAFSNINIIGITSFSFNSNSTSGSFRIIALNINQSYVNGLNKIENVNYEKNVISFYANANSTITISNIMINSGSTALPYQPYFVDIRDSAVTSIVSKDSNNTTLDTLTIPSEIQALEGYGWGINDTCYNYIDFETKKFIQKVARVKISEIDWNINANRAISVGLTDVKIIPMSQTPNIICNGLTPIKQSSYTSEDFTITTSYDSSAILIRDTSVLNSLEKFINKYGNEYIYYEPETPVETDISAYLTDDNFIEVVPNGTITFNNTYNQAVPSEITYLVEVQQ